MADRPLNGKRIGLLTASASRLGGGVFEAVASHAELLRGQGADVAVFALADRYSGDDAGRFAGCELYHAPVRGPGFFGYAPTLAALLDQARLDLLHLHGIWMYPSQAGSAWAARSGRPYLISPHGMLDPWITGRGRWKKALARAGYERRAWRRASAFHALTGREAEDIRRESGRADSLVIANAGPPASAPPAALRKPVIGYIGRIHPKKNLHALIDAWAMLDAAGDLPAGAELRIAGWGDPQDVAALEARLDSAPRSVTFLGPQYGADKARLLEESRFIALPSHSEGLPVAILEAWAAGTPVLMSEECNLPIGFAVGAAIDTGFAPARIAAALRDAFALDQAGWLDMARAANALATGPFSAEAIARAWAGAYLDLMEAGVPA
ncbi:MAG: glycosyltransferase [Sphingomonadaceae bacterium]|nr:glycosyltransferase [Sphingomonadaceae bacterium]